LITLPEIFNVASLMVDRHVAEGRSAKIAIECGDEVVTYQDLLERTNRVGNVLRRLGVDLEQRVLVALLDSPEFLYCFLGAIKIGAVAVPVNPLLRAQDYEYLLNDTRARVAVFGEASLAEIQKLSRDRLPYLKEIVVVGNGSASFVNFRELLTAASPDLRPEPTSKDDVAFWLYSSGSTGPPKGCIHLHHDMVVCSEAYAKGILRMNERDRCYSVARLFFAYGLGNAGYYPLYCGATTILSPARPTPAGIFADVERYRPTLFFSVPTNYAALLAYERQGSEFDFSSVRQAISAGESLPAALFERFKQRFGVEILDAWGSTEALQMVLSNTPGEARPGSSGKVIPGYEAKIVNEQGTAVPQGEIGQLVIKADSTCSGYWNQHEKTKATFDGGWFRTGDRYYQDEDGYFWYAGRADDLFKVNGRWVSPAEVESALIAHPAVREAAVVAREDRAGLIKPAAYVVLQENLSPSDALREELQGWVGQKLSNYKKPQWVEYLPELPKTATGKLQRFKLRELQRSAGGSES